MTGSIGTFYDIALLALLGIMAFTGMRRGFAAGFIRLAGSVAGIVGAVWATREWAPALYDRFIAPAVNERVAEALTQQGADAAALLGQELPFLPQAARESIAALLAAASGGENAGLVQGVVNALQPLLLPLLQAVVFILAVSAIKLLFGLLERLFRHLNGVPLLGTVNRIFGFCFGFVTGTLDCWIACILLWLAAVLTAGSLAFLNDGVLSQSAVYTFFSKLNPFIVQY